MRFLRFGLIFSLLSVAVFLLSQHLYGDIQGEVMWDRMGYAMGSILIISWLLSFPMPGSVWEKMRQFSGWMAVFLVLVTLYSFRSELETTKNRLIAAIFPSVGFEKKPGERQFFRSSNGHFHIEARVNGHPVSFLVDTGASDIVIAPHLAASLGFDLQPSDYTRVYHTANGLGRGAPVILSSFQIGHLKISDLPASINGAPMPHSLLGMRFFNRLRGYQVDGETLTIRW